jgi:hypothetical protein
MSIQAVLAPVFVLVALTFTLLFTMGRKRVGAVRQGHTRVGDIALGEPNWPANVTQASNAFNNQFQLPVLFYVLVALALIVHKTDILFVAMSWIFVALRIIHAGIHTTTNRIGNRFMAYTAGLVVLLAMWIIFALRILLAI